MEIDAWTTETTQFFAAPDGRTVQAYLNTGPVRVRRGGKWLPIDTTLVVANGVLRPKAAKNGLQLSAGGNGPVAKLRSEKGRAALLPPAGGLNKPTVSGNTAVYPDAYGKGVDLAVTASPTGFTQSLIIRERPERKAAVELPMALPAGLTFSGGPGGRPQLKDGKKKLVDITGVPMLDAAAVEGGPDDGRRAVAHVTAATDSELVLAMDEAFLADPATQYPVTVEAGGSEWLGAGRAIDTFVSSVQYPNSQGGSTWLRAGKSSNGGETWRTFIGFQMDASFQLMGAKILNADLRLWNYRSNACGNVVGSGIQVRRVTGEWNPSTISWSSQPATTTSGQVVNQAAYSDTCSWGEGELYYSIEPIAQAWADGAADNGLLLRAANESDATNWRQYRSAEYGYSAGTTGPRGPVLFVEFEPSTEFTYLQADKPADPPSQAEIDDIKSRESTGIPTYPGTDDQKIHDTSATTGSRTEVDADTQETPPDLTPEELTDLETPDEGEGYYWEPDDPDAPTPTPTVTPTGPPDGEVTVDLPLSSAASTTNWGYEEQGIPELVAGSYDWEDGTYDLSRTYLKFDAAALAGKTVKSAQLRLRSRYGYCTAAQTAIKAYRVTSSWDEATLTWDSQPLTSATPVITPDSAPSCDATADMNWNVTQIAAGWASGSPNNGIQLRADPEAQQGAYERYFDSPSSEPADLLAPVLSVTIAGSSSTAGRATTTASAAAIQTVPPFGDGFMTEAECRQHEDEARDPGVNAGVFWPGGYAKNRFNYCAIRHVGMAKMKFAFPEITHYIDGEAVIRIRTYNAGKDKYDRLFQARVTVNHFTTKGLAYPRYAKITIGMKLEDTPGPQRCRITGQTQYTYHNSVWPNTEAIFNVESVDDNDYDDLDAVAICKPRFWSKVTSLTENVSAASYDTLPSIRCDSAHYIVSSIGAGCVVYQKPPTLTYKLTDGTSDPSVPSNDPNSTYRSVAGHIWTAFNFPLKTTPYSASKTFPGNADARGGAQLPLYRSINSTKNNKSGRLIRAECDKLPDYDKTIRQCDEYPFNSTTASAAFASNYSWSVRPVTKKVNEGGGGRLGRFYTNQRILGRDGSAQREFRNWDPFYVKVQRPA
ncbi:DNRLRE domain-containing protein [Actinomadura sp. ATCC 31491]|uniref:DNRLRE domain-containing protein n=1 Tax=Actinomadura luzonensis TaxID=2805427 RepID=A0ABT0FIS8_9ACTN|nr:DNRLRE domain-containing protein [Actinomadura luzonensis]MCK2212213.1 DNRLRE domain-containing protein [Actinomadura luzonensis]